MKIWIRTTLLCLLSLFPTGAGAIVFNLGDLPNLSADAQVEYLGDTVTLTGTYQGSGKIARIEWELASDPITNTVVDTHAPKQNWTVTDNSPTEIIYSAPNDPTHYETYFYDQPLGASAADTHVSYTFDSAFTVDHKLPVGDTGWSGMEYIIERLYGDEPVTSFLNDDGTLLFEAATIEVVLGAKVANDLVETIAIVPSYQVTAVPESAHFTVILALFFGIFAVAMRRR